MIDVSRKVCVKIYVRKRVREKLQKMYVRKTAVKNICERGMDMMRNTRKNMMENMMENMMKKMVKKISYRIASIGKRVLCATLTMGMVALAGCGNATTKSSYVLNPVDGVNYNPSNMSYSPIMKGENGYYYRDALMGYSFHYYDNETKQSIYLCSRPECLHQGDEFCTATSNEYDVICNQLYDGEIYLLADRWEDETIDIHLLRIDSDGSNMTEIIRLQEDFIGSVTAYKANLYIHRGVCFISYLTYQEEKQISEFFIYDMKDNSIKYQTEQQMALRTDGSYHQALAINNRFIAYDNYVYFGDNRVVELNGKEKNKDFFCRYNLDTNEIEEAELEGTFNGAFAVGGNGETVYTDKFGHLYKYNWDDKSTTKYDDIKVPMSVHDGDEWYYDDNWQVAMTPSEILYYDGHYILLEGMSIYFQMYLYYESEYAYNRIAILDDDLKLIEYHSLEDLNGDLYGKMAEIYERTMGYEIGKYGFPCSTNVVDDDLYFQTPLAVFICPMEKIMHGDADFEVLYEAMSYGIY